MIHETKNGVVRACSEGPTSKNTDIPPVVRLIVFVCVFVECQTQRSDIKENIDKDAIIKKKKNFKK